MAETSILDVQLLTKTYQSGSRSLTVLDHDRLWITGQLAQWNGERRYIGKVGRELTLEDGQAAARMAALNCIAHLTEAVADDLDRVRQCIRVGVYVNTADGFTGQSQVANGASDLLVDVFGDRGRHTRLAIGVAALPYDAAVEVEAVFRVHSMTA